MRQQSIDHQNFNRNKYQSQIFTQQVLPPAGCKSVGSGDGTLKRRLRYPVSVSDFSRRSARERGKHDLELATKRSADALREGKEKSADLLAQAEKRAAQIVDEAKAAAKVEAERIVAAGKADAEQEAVRAKEQLRESVAALAVAGAEKILRREINAQAHADILAAIKQDL